MSALKSSSAAMARKARFVTGSSNWTAVRVARLSLKEIEQLRANALELGVQDVAALCDTVLAGPPRNARHATPAKGASGSRLVSRFKAFEAHGVSVRDRTSWGGVRKSDGAVVLTFWAESIQARHGAFAYLLWAPNIEGSRPWSETAAGHERLKHCRLLMQGAKAVGLLVHGEGLEGRLPEEKARSVHGVDPEVVVHFQVEKRGDEYWAVWSGADSRGKSPGGRA